ncbi:MAG: MBL fold metallo-hydrolase [Thermoleophilia bacterium]|nr:MBL fold metallo-hydrolase [Thermoleophilia bacterium]
MEQIHSDVFMIDTMLGGRPGITGAYVFTGDQPAIVDTGAETSADAVDAELAKAGIGPDDLAWIVLTHVHLDHCGAAGVLAERYPKATVVTHRRGAPHLVEPDRLVAGTEEIYGPFFSLYGGLQPIHEDRVVAAEDGHEVPIGPGRSLKLLDTPGHAPHHSVVLDEGTGTLIAGDAVGSRLAGSGLFPAYPPPRVDIAAIRASLARISSLGIETLCLAHIGAVDDLEADLARSDEQAQIYADAGMAAAQGGAEHADMAFALEEALPLSSNVGDEQAAVLWRVLGWERNNAMGVLGWARHEMKKAAEQA